MLFKPGAALLKEFILRNLSLVETLPFHKALLQVADPFVQLRLFGLGCTGLSMLKTLFCLSVETRAVLDGHFEKLGPPHPFDKRRKKCNDSHGLFLPDLSGYCLNSITISITLTPVFKEGGLMPRLVKAASVQFNIKLGEIDPNRQHVHSALAKLANEGVELVVLPEMWGTGFAYKELNELATRTGELVEELGALSAKYGMVIVGSLPEPHENKVYNTAYVLDHGKMRGKYRKIHLFSLMQEDRSFDSG